MPYLILIISEMDGKLNNKNCVFFLVFSVEVSTNCTFAEGITRIFDVLESSSYTKDSPAIRKIIGSAKIMDMSKKLQRVKEKKNWSEAGHREMAIERKKRV